MPSGTLVEAAGAVLWRPSADGERLEIALVHRPKYDDWSLPKGKLLPGEHPVTGALREIEEETGHAATVGRPLGEIRYVLRDGAPKRVRYWAMQAGSGDFQPGDEVDEVMWLPPGKAVGHLGPDRDRPVVDRFLEDVRPTRACIVVRHASAGSRDDWPGDDDERPLDETGRSQAAALVDVLSAYAPEHAYSADVLRCLDTIAPFTRHQRVPVDCEPLLSESGYLAHREAAVERFLAIADAPAPVVVCSQRKVIPGLVASAAERLGLAVNGLSLRKGAFLVLHLTTEGPARLVAVDRFSSAA